MRLLTHNALRCPAKDVTHGYPLQLEINEMEVKETEANYDFLRSQLPTLHWPSVLVVAAAVGLEGFPPTFQPSLLEDEDFLQAVHNLLIDIHVKTGTLICPESGRRFPIINGMPNMKLPESEV